MGASSVATCRYNINQINFVNYEILVPIKKVNLWGTCACVSTYINFYVLGLGFNCTVYKYISIALLWLYIACGQIHVHVHALLQVSKASV